jgi:hypothetical protein
LVFNFEKTRHSFLKFQINRNYLIDGINFQTHHAPIPCASLPVGGKGGQPHKQQLVRWHSTPSGYA